MNNCIVIQVDVDNLMFRDGVGNLVWCLGTGFGGSVLDDRYLGCGDVWDVELNFHWNYRFHGFDFHSGEFPDFGW